MSFTIIGAYTSKNGNQILSSNGKTCLVLRVEVCNENGDKWIVYDRIQADWPWKLKQIIEAIGIKTAMSNGFDEKTLVGQTGKCLVKTTTSNYMFEQKTYLNICKYLPMASSAK